MVHARVNAASRDVGMAPPVLPGANATPMPPSWPRRRHSGSRTRRSPRASARSVLSAAPRSSTRSTARSSTSKGIRAARTMRGRRLAEHGAAPGAWPALGGSAAAYRRVRGAGVSSLWRAPVPHRAHRGGRRHRPDPASSRPADRSAGRSSRACAAVARRGGRRADRLG